MANLKKVAKGVSLFLVGYVLMILLSWILPPLLDVGDAVLGQNDVDGIIWIGVILIWLAAILIIPNYVILEGIQEQNDLPPSIQIFIAITIFIFGVLFTVKGWYAIVGLANVAQNEFTLILYWIGIIITWFEIVVALPMHTIFTHMRKQ